MTQSKKRSIYFEKVRNIDDFGNGRYVRNRWNVQLDNGSKVAFKRKREVTFKRKGFRQITSEYPDAWKGRKEGRKSGSSQRKLDEMVGLDSVKTVIISDCQT